MSNVKTVKVDKSRRIKKSLGSRIADFCIYFFLIFFALMIIIPFYNMLLISFATFADVVNTPFYWYPKSITFDSYRAILEDAQFLRSIRVSVFNTLFGTGTSLIITVFAAYVLSRNDLPFRKAMFYFCIFTMFFSAGLIPWFVVIMRIGLANNLFVMTVPAMLSTFNMILVRNYFLSLPESLEESARLDGAGEFVIMFKIMVPLSMPIIATVALFYAVAYWNEWWTALIFIHDRNLFPLNYLLRLLVIENSADLLNEMANAMRMGRTPSHSRSLQMASVTVATIPILLVYPFLQRYFTKGIMLGAIKA